MWPGQPPVDPGFGQPRPPVDPGYGRPVGGGIATPPIYHPDLPGGPVQPLPPGGAPPAVSAGKPGGVPILPPDPSYKPPTTPPAPPGTWVTLDAGKGNPPAWGYVPSAPAGPPDHGLPGGPSVTPQGGAPPPGGYPTPTPGGHWVPIGSLAQPKGEPTWAYVPEIGPQYGLTPAAGPK